jgi:hypothetical protein
LVPQTKVAVFKCPRCDQEWRAQVVGDDVKPLPAEELVAPLA